jgi:hypothetical protein
MKLHAVSKLGVSGGLFQARARNGQFQVFGGFLRIWLKLCPIYWVTVTELSAGFMGFVKQFEELNDCGPTLVSFGRFQ